MITSFPNAPAPTTIILAFTTFSRSHQEMKEKVPSLSFFKLGMISGFSGVTGKRRGPSGESSLVSRTRGVSDWFSVSLAILWAWDRFFSFNSAIKRPTPWRDSIRLISSSDFNASRRVERLTPNCFMRSRSAGSWYPLLYVPSKICAAIWLAIMSGNDFRGISATFTSLMVYWSDHRTIL